MRKYIIPFSFILFLLSFQTVVRAQQKQMSGVVMNADGIVIPAATITVVETKEATTTNEQGRFSIKAATGQHLDISSVGYLKNSITIGRSNELNINLQTSNKELSEVVVTAQGIRQEKKSLGYAVTTIKADAIANRPESDIGRLLAGKAPGVSIVSTNGLSGSGTNISIRGFSSISGSTQPLFVIDGVPANTSTNLLNDFSEGNQTTPSRFLDIDPNSIKDIQILKGLSATVLYGEQGRNGVILITTKEGAGAGAKKPFEISVTQSLFANQIASLPDYQYHYGNGSNNQYGAFFGNWGPAFTDLDSIPDPLRNNPSFPQFSGKKLPFKPYKSVDNFFQTGLISSTSLSFGESTKEMSYSGTFSYVDENGFLPGNSLKKINGGLGITSNLTNKLAITSTFNYASTSQESPPVAASDPSSVTGGGSSIFANLFYTPISVDLQGRPWEDPITHASVYYRPGGDMQNPLWTIHNVKVPDNVSRFFGKTGLTYTFNKDFKLLYRLGLDTYNEIQEVMYNKGGVQKPNGLYNTTNITNTIFNHDLIATYAHHLSKNLDLQVTAGGNLKNESFRSNGLSSTNQLVYGLMSHSNFSGVEQINNGIIQKNTVGVYGQATLSYDQYLYLNLAARNDWYSSLEKNNRSIFYPSASLSFIPTSVFKNFESDVLNYLKLRIGYGTSAKSPDPYTTRNSLSTNPRAFIDNGGLVYSTNALSGVLGNPNLKAELQSEYEYGMEAQLFKNRLGVDLTYFDRKTTNLITNTPLDPSTGFSSTTKNIGELSNKGIELGLTGVPIDIHNFKWNIAVNFYSYKSKVVRLTDGLSKVAISGFEGNLAGNFAIPGKPYGVILETDWVRDSKGNPIITSGQHSQTDDAVILGDPNPDFTSSLINTFSYKGLSFGFQFDYRKGGDIFSTTAQGLLARGVTKDTDFDRSRTFIYSGVLIDGSPNNYQITDATAYYRKEIWDGTTFRLREISLSYSFPKQWFKKSFVKSASLRLEGQNLWFNAIHFPKHVHFDTDAAGTGVGNGLGLDFLNGPSSKRFGGTLSLQF
jgi:TonB-linked SusC/RagA family outer membrane protein